MNAPSPSLRDYAFELPPELIAQAPLADRTQSRLMALDRASGSRLDTYVSALPELLRGDELLVFNDTRVIPARLHGQKASGGKVELLCLEPRGERSFIAMGRSSKGLNPGHEVWLPGLSEPLVIETNLGGGHVQVRLAPSISTLWELCDCFGEIPLPPYVERSPTQDDKERYQTVFAREPGAVAAPTAGLHFTPELLSTLEAKGCERAFITLHVGPGTFAPVRTDNLDEHVMHSERYEVSETAAAQIQRAKAEGRPVLAVGTTVVRTLEAVAKRYGAVVPAHEQTDIFIREGHRFQVVDQLMTNFHLPASTLLVLVSAFAGRQFMLDAYAHAVAQGYRFFSYGDGMLIR